MSREAGGTTRNQTAKRQIILTAALEVFAEMGLRGATLERIAQNAGLSKQNIIYYFDGKEAIYSELLESLLDVWLSPLTKISPDGDPIKEILAYVHRKLEMSRDMPLQSKLFATEILQGAPRLGASLQSELKRMVEDWAAIIQGWVDAGKIAPTDPYHLIFSIWATTQHYADFDLQVQAILGEERSKSRYSEARNFLTDFYTRTLTP